MFDTFLCILLHPFTSPVASGQGDPLVGGCVWVENLDITEKFLVSVVPEAAHSNI